MPDQEVNLGKVHCKVLLYRQLPNLIIDPNKIRKSGSFVMTFQDETNISRKGFGIQFINAHNNVAAGVIPQPCYEPVDNFIDTEGSSSNTGTPIHWNKLDWKDISPLFKSAITTNPGPNNAQTPADKDLKQSPPGFQQHVQPVSLVQYSEEYYKQSMLGFRVSSTATTGSGSGSGSGYGPNVTTPVDRSFVYQTETDTKGVWWGIETKEEFRVSGGAFWVTIKPASNYLPESSTAAKTVWLGIAVVKDNATGEFTLPSTTTSGYTSTGGTTVRNDPWFLLLINNVGGVYLRYQREGRIMDTTVNLPHLSDRLRRGEDSEPFKVGFLIVCGRLVIYSDDNRYDVIDIYRSMLPNRPSGSTSATGTTLATNNVFYPGFDLSKPCKTINYKQVQVYGYGCTAYVNVCEMTFFKKCWFIMESMSGDDAYRGYKNSYDTSDLGLLVEWNIPQEQYENNGNRPMYAAQFHNYYEQDSLSVPPYSATKVCDSEDLYETINGAKRRWGSIWIVRSPPVKGVSEAVSDVGISGNFWFCYMETEDITEDGITHANVGYPILYDVFGQLPADITALTSPTMQSYSHVDISDNVISVNVDISLDDNQKPSLIQKTASVTVYDSEIDGNEYHEYLYKARGIKIWLKWSTEDIDISTTEEPVFSGVAFGERATIQPGKETIVFTCYDYWKILEGVEIKNSPFYDGFELISVVSDLVQRTGAKEPKSWVDHAKVGYYFLGSGFSFDKPSFRFDGEEKIKNCITKSVQGWPYYFWFDHDCIFNIGVIPGDFDWSRTSDGWDSDVKDTYYRYLESITVDTYYKLILNELSISSTLKDSLYNVFLLTGVDRTTNQPWYKFDRNEYSLGISDTPGSDPDTVGYLGYISEFRLQQPAMDSASASVFLDRYKLMLSKPGYETSFTTIGHVPTYTVVDPETLQPVIYPLRPGQFILVKQNITDTDKKFRVTTISHEYMAERNEWYTKIGAYQIQTISWRPVTTTPAPPPGP